MNTILASLDNPKERAAVLRAIWIAREAHSTAHDEARARFGSWTDDSFDLLMVQIGKYIGER